MATGDSPALSARTTMSWQSKHFKIGVTVGANLFLNGFSSVKAANGKTYSVLIFEIKQEKIFHVRSKGKRSSHSS